MQYTWQLALVLVPVYFIKHSVSCYIYSNYRTFSIEVRVNNVPFELFEVIRCGVRCIHIYITCTDKTNWQVNADSKT